jgi:hypothetical protein
MLPLADLDGKSDMYTIAIRTRLNGEIHDQVFGQFSDATLWDDLNVSERQWEAWRNAVNSAERHIPVIPDFPETSKLAYIDEGVVHFDPKQLHDDCTRLLPLAKSDATRQLIGDLLGAALLALGQENAEVIVHPFGESANRVRLAASTS